MSIPVFGNERCVALTVLKFIPPLKSVENWHRSSRVPYEVMLTLRLLNSTEIPDSSTSRTFHFGQHHRQFEKVSHVSPFFKLAKWDRTSKSYARMLRGEFTNDRQPEKFLLISLNHQEDPDSEADYCANQHQRQSN